MKPGVYPGLPFSDYLAIDAMNQSSLKAGRESMLHLWAARNEPSHETDDMRLGSCLHMGFLEPHKLADKVAVWDGGARRGKAWDEFCVEHERRVLLTKTQNESLARMLKAIRRHPFTREWGAKEGAEEVTAVRELQGVLCKARADWLVTEGADAPIIDVKKTRSANPEDFRRQAHNLGYFLQAGFYCSVFERTRFIFLCVEDSPAADVVPYEVTPEEIVAGWVECRELLRQWKACAESGKYPGRCPGAEPLPLERPDWAKSNGTAVELTLGGDAIAI